METQEFDELDIGDYVEWKGQPFIKGLGRTLIGAGTLGVWTVDDSDFALLDVPDGVLSGKAITALPAGSSVIDSLGTLWHKKSVGRGQRWEDGDGESLSNGDLTALGVRSVEPPVRVSERLSVGLVGLRSTGQWYVVLKRKDGTTLVVDVDEWTTINR